MIQSLCVPLLAAIGLGAEPQPPAALKIIIDYSQARDLEAWAHKAADIVAEWHPRIAQMLASEGFRPPMRVKLIFREMDGVAGTAGDTIYISAQWIRAHPDDFGMVIHELVHVVQAYPPGNRDAGWLVEGIADYIRFFHYEPHVKVHIDPQRSNYRKDGYRVAGAFLDWIVRTHGPDLIRKLNAALRKGKYRDDLFKELTGKTPDELWADFIATVD
jgi:hypothetical protein